MLRSTEVGKGRAEVFSEAQRTVHALIARSAGDSETGKVICLTVFLHREHELPRGAVPPKCGFNEKSSKIATSAQSNVENARLTLHIPIIRVLR